MIQGGDCVLNENISPEQYISEIKALNKKLNIAEQQIMDSAFIDKRNPFESNYGSKAKISAFSNIKK